MCHATTRQTKAWSRCHGTERLGLDVITLCDRGQPAPSSRCGRGHDVIAAINNRYNRVCADPNLSKLAGEHGGKMAGRHIIQIHYDTGGALARVPRGKTVRQESGQRGAGAGDGEGGRRGGICGGARTRRCQRVLDRTRGRAHLSFRPRGSARPRGSPSRACALRQSTAATRSSTRGCR